MAAAFSEYLPHFAVNALGSLDFGGRMKPLSVEPAQRERDIIAEAEARGRREGAEAARIEFEKVRAEDQADVEFRLAELKQQWVDETARAVAAQMDTGLAAIEASISGHVAGVLARVLDAAVQQRAIAEVSQILAAMAAGGAIARIRIAGPESLIARLRELPARGAAMVEYVVAADRPDVSVTIDDTVIETQLAAWGERIRAAVVGESHV